MKYRIHVPEKLRNAQILVVDDEPANLKVIQRLLDRAGYTDVRSVSDPREVAPLFRDRKPDLLLLDLHMPHLDGFEVMHQLRDDLPAETYFPILILTGDTDPAVRQRALAAGATDFVNKPFDVVEVALRIRNLLETHRLHEMLRRHNETLEERVEERTHDLAEAQVEILQRLALAAEFRDDITGHHAERVGILSSLLGERLGLGSEEVRLLRRAATLHDVGKIGIPDSILMKPGPLTSEEFEIMRTHTVIGGRILSGSRFPLLQMAREVALHHHDRWDGTGYTTGLQGANIPLVGRIVAVADVFDSLTHERPYKPASPVPEAVDLICEDRGAHFDPQVVDAFLELVEAGEVERLEALASLPLPVSPLPLGTGWGNVRDGKDEELGAGADLDGR